MEYKFDYLELMQRVERLSKIASEEQLRIHHQKITNLYRSLPTEYIDYRNLLHNIATKWHPQKKGMFFMDSAYMRVNTYEIENLLKKGFPDPDDARNARIEGRNSIILGSALTALGILGAVATAAVTLLLLTAFPSSFFFGVALAFVAALPVGLLALSMGEGFDKINKGEIKISEADTPHNNVKSLYETNEKLNETIDSFEKELLPHEVNKNKEAQQPDLISGPEDVTSYRAASSGM